MKKRKLGDLLVEAGLITNKQLDEALRDQENLGGRLGAILLDKGAINEGDYLRALTSQLGIPAADFNNCTIPEKVIKLVPRELAWEKMVVPMAVKPNAHGRVLMLAMADPTDLKAKDAVQRLTGCAVEPVLAVESTIRFVLMDYYHDRYGRGDYRLKKAVPAGPPGNPGGAPVAVVNTKAGEPAPGRSGIGPREASPAPTPRPEEAEARLPEIELVEDSCAEEHALLNLRLKAFLQLLIGQGILKPGEYTQALNKLKAAAAAKTD